MIQYDWNFARLLIYRDAFVSGLAMTIELSGATIASATTLGIAIGVTMASNKTLRTVLFPFIDVLKSIPPLVIVLFGYFFLTREAIGVTVPGFIAVVISLGFNVGAFIADLTRAAISNVSSEYIDLGRAIGLSKGARYKYIVAPFALREMAAPLSYIYIETIKLTSLASIINVKEVVYVANTIISETARSLEVWVVVGLIYIVLVLPPTYAIRLWEFRMKRRSGQIL